MSTQNNPEDTISRYDEHIIPAESAARQRREGEHFGHTTHAEPDGMTSHAASGYTVDREGLLNNYAIEPEMYVDVPGDLREQAARKKVDRMREMQEFLEDEDGVLT